MSRIASIRKKTFEPAKDQLARLEPKGDLFEELNYGQLYKQYLQGEEEIKAYRSMA